MALFHGTAQDILCQGFQIFESTEMLCGYRFRLGYGYTDLDTDTDFVSDLRGSLDPGLGLRSVRANLSGERDISRLAIDGSWLSRLRVSATMSRCKLKQGLFNLIIMRGHLGQPMVVRKVSKKRC